MAEIAIYVPDSVIIEALEKAIQALIERYDELGMRASGQWADELEADVVAGRGVIMGMPYTEQLVQGRAPGRMPPVDPIQKWVEAKLNVGADRSRGIAFAVARKIGQEGTTWYKQGGSDLVEVLQDPKVLEVFYEIVGDHLRVQITDILRRDLNDLRQ